jgi:hypothetical protein
MASFDSGARMDSSVRYDEAANPNTTRRSNKMPAITLDLDAKDDATLGEDTRAIILATDGKPKYAAVQTLITALKTASGLYDDALTDQLTKEAAAKAATQTKNDKRGAVEAATAALANGLPTGHRRRARPALCRRGRRCSDHAAARRSRHCQRDL